MGSVFYHAIPARWLLRPRGAGGAAQRKVGAVPPHLAANYWGAKRKVNQMDKFKYGNPMNRKFTKIAANMIGGRASLDAGKCPTCDGEITEFRNEISKKEFSLSGMCQKCQDRTFGVD